MDLPKNDDTRQTSFCGYFLECNYSKQKRKIDFENISFIYASFFRLDFWVCQKSNWDIGGVYLGELDFIP